MSDGFLRFRGFITKQLNSRKVNINAILQENHESIHGITATFFLQQF